jgi:hypothetical protein
MNAHLATAAELAALWRNPAFLRFCRSRLRFRKAIFWYLLTAIVATFVVMVNYLVAVNIRGVDAEAAARNLFLPLLIIQGLILMGKGTAVVSAGLIQDKIDQTLDYQRLTPMTPLHSVLGYLFGLPVLEYAMVALTLPHLAFIVAVGNIPAATVATVYTAFFSCAVLYHLIGIAAGMVMRRWVLGYVLSVLLVFGINVVLPLVVSQFGLRFFQYLSIWPVVGQTVLPLTVPAELLASTVQRNPFFAAAFADVAFFNWQLSPFLFTLLLQGALIVTLGIMAVRRWESSMRHSLSKPYALGFLAAFVVLVIGNVWPAITGQFLPFAIFGETNLDAARDGVALGFPLVYGALMWSLCLLLFSIVIPTHNHYMRGIRRAHKQGRAAARPWENDAAALWFLGLFVVVAMVGFGVLYRELRAAGFFDRFAASELWRLPVACGLVLSYTAMLLLVFEHKKTVLLVLLTWFLPILTAIVLSVAAEDVATLQAAVAGLSPIAYLTASGFMPLTGYPGLPPLELVDPLTTTANVGLAAIGAQTGFLLWRWRRLDARFQAACAPAAASAAASHSAPSEAQAAAPAPMADTADLAPEAH